MNKTSRVKKRTASKSTKAAKSSRNAKARRTKRAAKVKRAPKTLRAATKPRRDRRSAEERIVELKRRLSEINDLGAVTSVLSWDEATYMPNGGAGARGRQTGTVSRVRHEKLSDPALGRLIDGLVPHAHNLPPDSDDAALIEIAQRDFERAS